MLTFTRSICLWTTQKKKPVFTYALAHGMDESHVRSEDVEIVRKPRWVTAIASLRYSDLFATGQLYQFTSRSRTDARIYQALGTARSDCGSSTPNSNHFLPWAVYQHPALSTPCSYCNAYPAQYHSSHGVRSQPTRLESTGTRCQHVVPPHQSLSCWSRVLGKRCGLDGGYKRRAMVYSTVRSSSHCTLGHRSQLHDYLVYDPSHDCFIIPTSLH